GAGGRRACGADRSAGAVGPRGRRARGSCRRPRRAAPRARPGARAMRLSRRRERDARSTIARVSAIRSIQLFYQEGSSDKVYNATIVKDGDAYTVKVEWGRRGSNLNQGSKAVKVSLAVAQKKYDSLVREKRNKGYEEITVDVQPAAVAPPEGQGSG